MNCIGLVVGTIAILALGGCASTTRIEARDHRLVVPSVRASVNFSKGIDAPSDPQDGHSIEFDASSAKGSDTQSLEANQLPVILDGKTFAAPQQLHHEFRYSHAHLSWRWRKFFGGGSFGMEVLAGVGYAGLDLSTSAPGLQAAQGFHTRGAQGAFGLLWRIQSGTSLQARISEFASLRDGVGRDSRAELFLVQALGKYVSARVG